MSRLPLIRSQIGCGFGVERTMGVYDRFLLPRLIDCACGIRLIGQQRALLVPGAEGRVLEVGVGSGLNFPWYDRQRVEELFALEPSAELRRMASAAADDASLSVSFLDASAEAIPVESDSVDTVVMTYTLCSIANPEQGLAEIRRVLKPNGRLLFAEHGRAPERSVQRWQDRLTPLWKRLAGGCHLNRDIPGLVAAAGFDVQTLDARYLSRLKAFAFNLGERQWRADPSGIVARLCARERPPLFERDLKIRSRPSAPKAALDLERPGARPVPSLHPLRRLVPSLHVSSYLRRYEGTTKWPVRLTRGVAAAIEGSLLRSVNNQKECWNAQAPDANFGRLAAIDHRGRAQGCR